MWYAAAVGIRNRPSGLVTRVTDASNAVVLIAGSERLLVTTTHAAASASGARVLQVTMKNAATLAAETRPYALVVPRDVHEFGASEFEALARDVDAELVVVPDNIHPSVLGTMLLEAASRLG